MQAKLTGLEAVLERNRLQQKDIAEALGVSRNAVHAWVHGHSVPTGTNLVRLIEFLNAHRVSGEPEIVQRDILFLDAVPAAEERG